ncbi:MAG: ABC transporter substrate-binding protein [Microcoleaceae cyanobacterium]
MGSTTTVSTQGKWVCDGAPKNSDREYYGAGPHEPCENDGPDCMMCGLPKEAMTPPKTIVSRRGGGGGSGGGSGGGRVAKEPIIAIAILLLFMVGGAGGFWYLTREKSQEQTEIVDTNKNQDTTTPTQTNSLAIISDTASNPLLISQGETVLFAGGKNFQQKSTAAEAFANKNWDTAIQQYQQAVRADPNDPEAKIYLNNAKAKKSGNLMTMAVVVPVTPSVNEAKEVLRGVAQYQDEFNGTLPGQFLEVVIVDEAQGNLAESLAQDLINSPVNVLGVMGHGVDSYSRQALQLYEQNNLAVLSSLNTAITSSGGKSTVRTIPLSQSATLLGRYLENVGETLANYAVKNNSPANVIVFYNSDSPYSQQLKNQFVNGMSNTNGKVIEEVDITVAGFDASKAMENAGANGANVAFLALSKNKVNTAINLGKANNNRLSLLGADELYNPTILAKGNEAINGLVLAVPWQWNQNDSFASQAAKLWQGRISWRTATSYDATQALVTAFENSPGDRAGISQELNQGVSLAKSVTDFNIFDKIPLVKAVPGKAAGFNYQFDSIQ